MKNQKQFSDLNDKELFAFYEYKSWASSDAPIEYKLNQLEFWMQRAFDLNIQHLLIK